MSLLRRLLVLLIVPTLVLALLALTPRPAAAATGAPCAVRPTYSALALSCYGAPAQPIRARYQLMRFPATQTSDRTAHVAVIDTRTATIVSFRLDANERTQDVVCAAAWGFSCRYVYR